MAGYLPETPNEELEGVETFQLDPTSFEPVAEGGRWYNIPRVHPISRQYMDEETATIFALQRGYLGEGFDTVDEAVSAAIGRNDRVKAALEKINPEQALLTGQSRTESIQRFPYNIAGRAPDGFRYDAEDIRMLLDGSEELANIRAREQQAEQLFVPAQVYPSRPPGSQRSYEFQSRFGAARSTRYSDQPTPNPGETLIGN
jgi:hypothetical protein